MVEFEQEQKLGIELANKTQGYNIIRIASFALEDANQHSLAGILFSLADLDIDQAIEKLEELKSRI